MPFPAIPTLARQLIIAIMSAIYTRGAKNRAVICIYHSGNRGVKQVVRKWQLRGQWAAKMTPCAQLTRAGNFVKPAGEELACHRLPYYAGISQCMTFRAVNTNAHNPVTRAFLLPTVSEEDALAIFAGRFLVSLGQDVESYPCYLFAGKYKIYHSS